MGSHFGEMSDKNNDSNDEALYEYTHANRALNYDESLNYANLFNYKEASQDLSSLNLPSPLPDQITSGFTPTSGVESPDDSDSDDVLKYISLMLMEEDMEEKPCMFHDPLALHAAEKPFYDALGKKYPPSPDQHPFHDHFVDSPDDNHSGSSSEFSSSSSTISSSSTRETVGVFYGSENNKPAVVQTRSVESNFELSTVSPWSFGSSSAATAFNESMISPFGLPLGMNIFSDKESMIQFQKGMDEASKFLPKASNLIIDLENITFPDETKEASTVVVKTEKDEHSPDELKGMKVHYREDEGIEEGKSRKQSAISLEEEAELSEMFDKVLLCPPNSHEAHCSMGLNTVKEECSPKAIESQIPESGKGRPRKQENSKNMVDLRTLLILCAQATSSDDRRTADELLKQIRKHSSTVGDGSQRLAHYFADALEARLAGTGSQIYTALSSKRTTAVDMIKAYQFFIRATPFKKITLGFSNHMILKAAEQAPKLHVIDFGILYGFQWPVLIQRLSERPGGPPKLCITGVDLPQPGFKPAERVEATGRRLERYCERFNVPFEYHAIAQKWETIKVEDLKIESDAVVVVNSLFRFKYLLDETIVVDSPRDTVLSLIRRIKPHIFLHGIVNGSYNAPFFVTRFREALFYYSTLFDMFDTNASREDPERLMFEKEFFGREIMNVVSCEGTERVERPETYKQWQGRITRAGFKQLPLDEDLIKKLRCKVKANYHKDFLIDFDGHWTLQGWKGRITHAVSAWLPS